MARPTQPASVSYLYAVASRVVGPNVSPESFVVYLDQILDEAGQPTDPIERMLIEQIAMAHHNIGRLYVRASLAETLDQVNVYNAAAARLLAEFRRATLALKKYREPTPPRNYTLVKQQNVAQNQQVAFVNGEASGPRKSDTTAVSEKNHDSELESKEAIEHVSRNDFIPQSSASVSRQTEPAEAKRAQS